MLTGSDDNTARLWDVPTGHARGEPLQHESEVRAVAFSPDGQTVVTGSADNVARLWDVPPPALDEPDRLLLSIEVRTGIYFDQRGKLKRMSFDQWMGRRTRLDEHGGFCDVRTWDELSARERAQWRTPLKPE